MRVSIALLYGLAANSALAQAPTTQPCYRPTRDSAAVPPLVAGESGAADLPNYFDARELGAATRAARRTCQEFVALTVPDADAVIQSACWDCVADAPRWTLRVEGRWTPTDAQTFQCLDAIRDDVPSPFAARFPIDTADFASISQVYLKELGAGATPDRDVVCSCATDAWLAHKQKDAAEMLRAMRDEVFLYSRKLNGDAFNRVDRPMIVGAKTRGASRGQ